jgi:argininosuccinate synthase
MSEFCVRFQGRNELLEYAKLNNIPVSATLKSPWSMDANICHISYESGILEDPSQIAPEELFMMTRNPQSGPDLKSSSIMEVLFVVRNRRLGESSNSLWIFCNT